MASFRRITSRVLWVIHIYIYIFHFSISAFKYWPQICYSLETTFIILLKKLYIHDYSMFWITFCPNWQAIKNYWFLYPFWISIVIVLKNVILVGFLINTIKSLKLYDQKSLERRDSRKTRQCKKRQRWCSRLILLLP